MNAITVATFNTTEQAEPLRDQLERAGIHAEIHNETVMERLWFVAKPLAGVRVKVDSTDYGRAKNLLGVWDTESGVLRDAIRCPECGSSRIEYPQKTRKFFLPNLVGTLTSGLGFVEKEFYCEDCQYTWPRTGTKASVARPNQAPYYFIEGVSQPPPSNPQRVAEEQQFVRDSLKEERDLHEQHEKHGAG